MIPEPSATVAQRRDYPARPTRPEPAAPRPHRASGRAPSDRGPQKATPTRSVAPPTAVARGSLPPTPAARETPPTTTAEPSPAVAQHSLPPTFRTTSQTAARETPPTTTATEPSPAVALDSLRSTLRTTSHATARETSPTTTSEPSPTVAPNSLPPTLRTASHTAAHETPPTTTTEPSPSVAQDAAPPTPAARETPGTTTTEPSPTVAPNSLRPTRPTTSHAAAHQAFPAPPPKRPAHEVLAARLRKSHHAVGVSLSRPCTQPPTSNLPTARRATFLLFAVAACAAAQQQPGFTIDQVLSAAFPTELTAAPANGRVAWVSNARGVRNVLIAEPPEYRARAITSYTADDGQEITQLAWTPDASAVLYVRGGELNPAHNPHGVEEAVWLAPVSGGPPRKIADGSAPAVSPKGDRVAFLRGGQVWWAPLDGKSSAARAFQSRGASGPPIWSPDGSRIAFTSSRGDHGLIGVYTVTSDTLQYPDPSTDYDLYPAWSPDSRSIAFVRIPSSGLRAIREPRRTGEPWSIRVAAIETGAGREVWRAREGRGSVYREVVSASQLHWADGARIVFPWEGDGWTHLYSVAAAGGAAQLLTPGEFEVEDAALSPDHKRVVYSSNQGDIDRRHIWTVAAAGGVPSAITSGDGIECRPAALPQNEIAFLRSDARRPLRAAIRVGGEVRDLDPGAIPADFPVQRMVAPRQVILPAADGLAIHGQLFLPPNAPPRAPALVFFHGGSRRQMLLGWHPMYYYSNAYALNQFLANSGYIVLSINYRSGIGYGLDFREALHYGPAGGSEYNDVQGAGLYLRTRTDVDPARIGAWGGSYGGYLTAMALARASDLFRAGVDFHGVHNWATELGIPAGEPDYQVAFDSSPLAFVKEWRSPVLLIQGDADPDVQFNNTVMLYDALRRQKVDVERLIFPDESHDFLLWRTWRAAYAATVDFFQRKMK
jgi:dipeptidyl aminopeptidase/acylaminoacyl peptidase